MKITYLHQHFRKPSQGGGTRSYEFARRLAERGHSIDLVTASADPDSVSSGWHVDSSEAFRVHYARVPYSNRMSAAQRIRAFLRFAVGAARRAAALDSDVVFATSTPLTIAVPGAYAAARRKVPMVFEVRDLWPEVPIAMGFLGNPAAIWAARRLERFAYARSDHIIALSEGMKEGVRRVNGDRAPVTVIPNSCDIELFRSVGVDRAWLNQAYSIPEQATVLAYCGTLGVVNNVPYLIEMMDELRRSHPEAVLLIVGDGAQREHCVQLAQRLGLLGSSVFIGAATDKQTVARILATAAISFSVVANIPELFHNSANKFFDTLASGTPMVINHGGWQQRVLEQSGAGLAIPVDDPSAGARMLAQRLSDQTWLDRAANASAELASQFDRSAHLDEIERILTDVVERRSRR